ncbi:Wzz/FepE/Etk N-terminal domain-containing protein [Salibacteraceae bacterium]|nr:Wzz/FepE/Etk N-terminal domain-containing protein [Salibacteraceae bacterium]
MKIDIMDENVKYVLKDDADVELSLKRIAEIIFSNKLKIALFSLLVGLAGFIYNVYKSPYYDANATLASTMFGEEELMPVLESFDELVSKNDFVELSNELKLPLEIVNKLEALEVTKIGTGGDFFTCKVHMQVLDTTIIEDIANAVVTNLYNNAYLMDRFDRKKAQLSSVYEVCNTEIEEMKTSKKKINQAEGRGDQNALNLFLLNSRSEIVHLEEKASLLKLQLEMLSIAYYLKPAVIPNEKSGPHTTKNTLAMLIAGAFVSMLFFVAIEAFK